MKKLVVAVAASAAALGMMGSVQAADLARGKQVYDQACFACHGMGVAGAPKLGDAAAWAPRIQQGMDVMVQHAIQGFQGKTGFMPPKGGRMDLSDEQVADAVAYMAENSK